VAESCIIFFIIVGSLLALLAALALRDIILSVVYIVVGLGLIVGGISLLVKVGGLLGAIGILMALAGGGSGWFGIYGLIESCKELSR
jgi:hypothetical protein